MTDELRAADFRPIGGSWSGLLFNNPGIRLPTRLTWSFDFNFAPIELDGEEASLGVTVEWAELPRVAAWTAMAGTDFSSESFGESAEASIYCFMHHRFDRVQLRFLEQTGTDLHVQADLSGDLDGLGIPNLSFAAWLRFTGIFVQVEPRPQSVVDAAASLSAWTSVQGLDGKHSGNTFSFAPGP